MTTASATIELEIKSRQEQFETRDQIRRNEFRNTMQAHQDEYTDRVKRLEEIRAETGRVDESKTDDIRKVHWLMEQERARHKQEMARLAEVMARAEAVRNSFSEKHSLLIIQMEQEILSVGADHKAQQNCMLFDHISEKQQEDGEMNMLTTMANEKALLLEIAQRYVAAQATPTKAAAPTKVRPPSSTSAVTPTVRVAPSGPLLKDKMSAIGLLARLDGLVESNQLGGKGTRDTFGRDADDLRGVDMRTPDVSEVLVSEQQLRSEFEKWDTNGDGTLDEEEFLFKVTTLERWGAPPMSRVEALGLLHRTTVMGHPVMEDKRITFEEWSVLMLSFRRR